MASLLRQIVASPRVRHDEAGLDLCYVTDTLIATSGPSATYPSVAYRNPLKDLVKFLNAKHGSDWAIWEFRAEGTGYPDEAVGGRRVNHYPWPDHHPPPFALIPLIMAGMREWLNGKEGRVAVMHCKAGKGRSGTVTASYMISEEGWEAEAAKQRFTERRMRPGFGNGISIPSQVRTITYVDRWTKGGKMYVERPVEVVEVHVWGLRDGVKIAVEGFVEEGKVIKAFHTFTREEREIVRGKIQSDSGIADVAWELMGRGKDKKTMLDPSPVPKAMEDTGKAAEKAQKEVEEKQNGTKQTDSVDQEETTGDVIFRPSTRVVLPSSDINIDFERRNKSKYGGFTMVTSVAHVWFNTFFEGNGPEQNGKADDSGVFEIEWDAMDGIKGSSRKGTRAFDKLLVVWKAVDMAPDQPSVVIHEPGPGEEVKQTKPADWRGGHDDKSQDFEKKLGLRADTTESAAISRASSVKSKTTDHSETSPVDQEGVQSHIPDHDQPGKLSGLDKNQEHLHTNQLPDGVPEEKLQNRHRAPVGSIHFGKMDDDRAS